MWRGSSPFTRGPLPSSQPHPGGPPWQHRHSFRPQPPPPPCGPPPAPPPAPPPPMGEPPPRPLMNVTTINNPRHTMHPPPGFQLPPHLMETCQQRPNLPLDFRDIPPPRFHPPPPPRDALLQRPRAPSDYRDVPPPRSHPPPDHRDIPPLLSAGQSNTGITYSVNHHQGPQSQLSFRKVSEQSVADHPTWYDNSTSQSCSNPFIPSSASQSDTHISFDKYSARNMEHPEQPVHSPHGGPFRDQPKDGTGYGVPPLTDRPPGGSLEGSRVAEWSQPSLHPMEQSPHSSQWRKPQLCAPRAGSPQTHNNSPIGLESTSSQPYGHREQHFRPPSSNLPPVFTQGEGRSPSASSQHGLQVPLKPTQPRKLYIIDDVLDPTNKDSPSHVVIMLRGLPGSGKSEVAKSLKDKESKLRGRATRILSLDSYFLVDDEDSDGEEGYDEAVEESYRQSMLKSFVKLLSDGFFPMVIIEAVNHKVSHIERFWQEAKKRGFDVYVADLHASVDLCLSRSKHKFKKEELQRLLYFWEEIPLHYNLLDVTSCTHDSNIEEIEMEDETKPPPDLAYIDKTEEEITVQEAILSKWEDVSDEQLEKLDGVSRKWKRKRKFVAEDAVECNTQESAQIEVPTSDPSGTFKKRVRWADIEAQRKDEENRLQMGFVMGSRWARVPEEKVTALLQGEQST